ncbi:peptide chain release factor N(5)-glutamine methyltransferase [Candidatus Falkowbacteria bacterium CG10_big_fil_rev_8_21_14_0_10_43_11]|uniref:Peptide chain release factor N(5)-glutamine methyltransferase n=1 Tax=Candidatus Falkowbacteria bacterium CG10_big_fil_rev_8_21_14_0_10_43_11 TaxID=1974568 RepID=A0A2M6WKY0_9BACT|nr:MAG: peptide chain release factor N(5)-glutamine methyltransferase [Candidatus Falkowbacteria bacterium CG10_big_fil_rev_8_21_14_0_10_43_11]
MPISQVILKACQKLQKFNLSSAFLDAELLLSFVLRKPREYVLAHPEIKLTKKQILKFYKLIAQRAKNIPLAYLTGVKEFYGREFYVDKRVLVPRPETETLIEQVKSEKLKMKSDAIIVDIGTGSGCIIITLAKELENLKSKISNLKFLATDVSLGALAVAKKNARLHGVADKIKFMRGNLLEPILKNRTLVTYNLLFVANLPYLMPTQIKNSPTIKHEPLLALSAGKDGLKYYRQLANQLQQFNIKYPNISISLFCEIDPEQSKAIKKIFSLAKSMEIKKDLAGRNRLFIARF